MFRKIIEGVWDLVKIWAFCFLVLLIIFGGLFGLAAILFPTQSSEFRKQYVGSEIVVGKDTLIIMDIENDKVKLSNTREVDIKELYKFNVIKK